MPELSGCIVMISREGQHCALNVKASKETKQHQEGATMRCWLLICLATSYFQETVAAEWPYVSPYLLWKSPLPLLPDPFHLFLYWGIFAEKLKRCGNRNHVTKFAFTFSSCLCAVLVRCAPIPSTIPLMHCTHSSAEAFLFFSPVSRAP